MSEQELKEEAMAIGKKYVEKLEEKSRTLDLKQLRTTYGELADQLLVDLTKFFDEKNEHSYLRGSIVEDVMNYFRDENNKIREGKKV